MSKLSTKVLPCECEHAYQDKAYGKNKRVHNPNKSGYKCTVCGKPKGFTSAVEQHAVTTQKVMPKKSN